MPVKRSRSTSTTRSDSPTPRGRGRGRSDTNDTARDTTRDTGRSNVPARKRRDTFTGASAREESERIVAEAKKRQADAGKMPFRFYMGTGDEKSFIILDEEPTFFRWEHEEWDKRNKRMNYHGCVTTTDNCPACDALEHRSYFAMYLTIIDLTPFTTKAGVEVEYSKKLLVVKQNQHKLFFRKFDRAGSLRGMLFDSFRDKKTDARIGGTLELAETLDEDELQEYIRVFDDRDGNEKTEDVNVYDYEDLFPETSVETLEKTFGVKPAAGSAREAQRELEDDYGSISKVDPDDDSTPFEGGKQVNPPRRGRQGGDTGRQSGRRRR